MNFSCLYMLMVLWLSLCSSMAHHYHVRLFSTFHWKWCFRYAQVHMHVGHSTKLVFMYAELYLWVLSGRPSCLTFHQPLISALRKCWNAGFLVHFSPGLHEGRELDFTYLCLNWNISEPLWLLLGLLCNTEVAFFPTLELETLAIVFWSVCAAVTRFDKSQGWRKYTHSRT